MNALPSACEPEAPARVDMASLGCASGSQVLASHGKSGIVGVFTTEQPINLRRGGEVILQTSRGVELGAVLAPAGLQQARLIGPHSRGQVLRAATIDDLARRAEMRVVEQRLFDSFQAAAIEHSLALDILDVDLLFDGHHAIVQFVGAENDAEALADWMEARLALTLRLENLAAAAELDSHEHGCSKPDCGQESGGGCTSCGSGGCSSCGAGPADLSAYFGHLRAKMESNVRIPLA